mmetsp:Transcript_25787/g.53606  ORF Transcript_25787/g.53606 Transcript_25787/m.53606 type:complete len:312 (-) Transcript_25787:185-1120(-)
MATTMEHPSPYVGFGPGSAAPDKQQIRLVLGSSECNQHFRHRSRTNKPDPQRRPPRHILRRSPRAGAHRCSRHSIRRAPLPQQQSQADVARQDPPLPRRRAGHDLLRERAGLDAVPGGLRAGRRPELLRPHARPGRAVLAVGLAGGGGDAAVGGAGRGVCGVFAHDDAPFLRSQPAVAGCASLVHWAGGDALEHRADALHHPRPVVLLYHAVPRRSSDPSALRRAHARPPGDPPVPQPRREHVPGWHLLRRLLDSYGQPRCVCHGEAPIRRRAGALLAGLPAVDAHWGHPSGLRRWPRLCQGGAPPRRQAH